MKTIDTLFMLAEVNSTIRLSQRNCKIKCFELSVVSMVTLLINALSFINRDLEGEGCCSFMHECSINLTLIATLNPSFHVIVENT